MARYLLLSRPGSTVPDRMKWVDDAVVAPTAADDAATRGVSVGSIWIDQALDRVYMCIDASEGAAVWVELT